MPTDDDEGEQAECLLLTIAEANRLLALMRSTLFASDAAFLERAIGKAQGCGRGELLLVVKKL